MNIGAKFLKPFLLQLFEIGISVLITKLTFSEREWIYFKQVFWLLHGQI